LALEAGGHGSACLKLRNRTRKKSLYPAVGGRFSDEATVENPVQQWLYC